MLNHFICQRHLVGVICRITLSIRMAMLLSKRRSFARRLSELSSFKMFTFCSIYGTLFNYRLVVLLLTTLILVKGCLQLSNSYKLETKFCLLVTHPHFIGLFVIEHILLLLTSVLEYGHVMKQCICQCLQIMANTLVPSVGGIKNGDHQAKKKVRHYLDFIYPDRFCFSLGFKS